MVKKEKNVRKKLFVLLCTAIMISLLVPAAIPDEIQNNPPVADAGGPYIEDEGSTVYFDGSASYDPDGDPLFYNWDLDDDGIPDLRFWVDSPLINYTWYDDYIGYVTLFVSESSVGENPVTDTTMVTIQNVDPAITTIEGSILAPVAPGQPVNLTCYFTDPGIYDSHFSVVIWNETVVDVNFIRGYNFTSEHIFTQAGIFPVTIIVEDDDEGHDEETIYAMVYEMNTDDFVTGGGWILSPEGAYQQNTSLTGKATFGFVSKYKKGETIPTGNTEFQFHAAGLNFHSSTYEWLIVTGARATFQGLGTINGIGGYAFNVVAIDGKLTLDGIDRFRMHIWEKDSGDTIYDNLVNEVETPLSAGQIVIHKK